MGRSRIEADVAIIGTGPAGATFARVLARQGKTVVMVDSGPQMRSRPGEHLINCFRYQHEPNLSLDEMLANREPYSIPPAPGDPNGRLNFQNPEQDPTLNMPGAASMYAVGGMFSFWSAFAPDPTPEERTPLIPVDEWERALAITRRLFNVHRDAFEPSAVSRALGPLLGADFAPAPMGAEKRAADCDLAHLVTWTGVDTILGPLVDARGRCARNLRILEEYRAEELVWARRRGVPAIALGPRGGDRIEHVLVRDLRTFETKKIHADAFVVAGGAFFTPRLLWQSGLRPPALGCYLHENPTATVQLVLNQAVIDALRADVANPARGDALPIAWNDAPPKIEFAPTAEKPWMGHVNRAGYTMMYDLKTDIRLLLDLTWYGMVDPVPTNRVVFSERYRDRFGMPQVTIEFRMGDDDTKRANAMLADLTAVSSRIGTAVPLSRPPYTAGPSLQPAGTSVHLMGTCRMGTDPATSVVDPDCKVWGVDNLWVSGGSVIPNRMASNPTLTFCAVAARAAWKLLGCPLADVARDVGIVAPAEAPTVPAADGLGRN